MRTAHWKARLLPLLLLSLHLVSVCLANSCIFDECVKKFGPLNVATAAHQPTGQNWESLRIVTSTKDLKDPSIYCPPKDASNHERSTEGAADDCRRVFGGLSSAQQITAMDILQRAIALHTDRLLVQRAVGPLKIPDFSTHQICKYFHVPAKHHTDGVDYADMVLYVASGLHLVNPVEAVFLGVTCAKSKGGRPIAGVLSLESHNMIITHRIIRIAAHHIAHALGFSYGEMHARSMIIDKKVRDKTSLVAVVKSEKAKKMAQKHYGCSTADGMELEDGKDNNETLSHWEQRNAKDELMAQYIGGAGTSFMGFYTTLTMAAFEDMSFFKANFRMAEHMEYGHNTGCEFLTGKCMDKGVTKWPNMFCNAPMADKKPNGCTTNRLGMGRCTLREDDSPPLPAQFQYFASANKGGEARHLIDYCPVIREFPPFRCRDSLSPEGMPGSLVGKNSMCLDGNALKVRTKSGTVSVPAVCAEISCAGGSVKVKYLGDPNTWHDCPEGKSLTPSSTLTSFESGTIKCPKYKEVCTVSLDGRSLVPKVPYAPMEPSPSTSPAASDKSTGQPNDPNSVGKSTDSSSVPFGLFPSVVFRVLSFAGYLIA